MEEACLCVHVFNQVRCYGRRFSQKNPVRGKILPQRVLD